MPNRPCRFLAPLLLLGAVLAAPDLPGPAQAAEMTAHEKQLYEAAKKEGQLTWYVSHYTVQTADALGEGFTKEYPDVKVNVVRTTAQVAFQRLNQDMQADVAQCDVFSSTDIGHYIDLAGKDLLMKYTPENEAKVFDPFKGLDPDGRYFVTSAGLIVISYNTGKVKEADAPKNWPELLEPKWKDKVSLGSPAFSGYVGTWTVEMRKLYGWEFFDKMAKNNPQIGRSINDTVTMLNAGERQIGVSAESVVLTSASKGNPLAIVYPKDGALLMIAPSGIMKNSKHPNAAKLFMEYLLSPPASEIVVKDFIPPMRPEVKPAKGAKPISEVKTIRPSVEEIKKGIPEVIKAWRNTFGL